MTRGCTVSALTGALGLAGLLGLASCQARPKAERKGPFLSIRQDERETTARRDFRPASIALALGGLPAEELTRLRDCLAAATDAAVRRAAPMLFDVTGPEDDAGPAPDPLREALSDFPALTAAANMLGGPWHAPGISVALGPSCEAAASGCVPLFAPAAEHEEALVRRGRALAWTLGNAVVLHVLASSRAALVRSLRQAQTRPSGTIALVFDAPRGVLDGAKLDLLRDEAREHVARLARDAPQRPWLDALGAARPEWALPIALDADAVLVIPRLSALARLKEFQAEVEVARGPVSPGR